MVERLVYWNTLVLGTKKVVRHLSLFYIYTPAHDTGGSPYPLVTMLHLFFLLTSLFLFFKLGDFF